MPAFRPEDFPRKSPGLFPVEHDGVSDFLLRYDGGTGIGVIDPRGDVANTQHQLAGYPAAPRSIHFSDSGDPNRSQIGESTECGGVPAECSIPGYSGYSDDCWAVHRLVVGECLDFAGIWFDMCIACMVASQDVYGKIHL